MKISRKYFFASLVSKEFSEFKNNRIAIELRMKFVLINKPSKHMYIARANGKLEMRPLKNNNNKYVLIAVVINTKKL